MPSTPRRVVFGFTGTGQGMAPNQRLKVLRLLQSLGVNELHHGDCIGADAQADDIAEWLRISIVVHPPSDERRRAFCLTNELRSLLPPKGYLARNRDIVKAAVDGMIAAPSTRTPPPSLRGQGTWTTIGYARRAGRPLWIVYPDGQYTFEAPAPTSQEPNR